MSDQKNLPHADLAKYLRLKKITLFLSMPFEAKKVDGEPTTRDELSLIVETKTPSWRNGGI
ncbi:MAG: hypothetical protein AAF984_03655 [Verrucomicrobiota bacterium]